MPAGKAGEGPGKDLDRIRVTTATFGVALVINVRRHVHSELGRAQKEASDPQEGAESFASAPISALQAAIEAVFRPVEPHFALVA